MQPQDGGVERDVCDKLLMLCDMFGVTLDDLVMGDVLSLIHISEPTRH